MLIFIILFSIVPAIFLVQDIRTLRQRYLDNKQLDEIRRLNYERSGH